MKNHQNTTVLVLSDFIDHWLPTLTLADKQQMTQTLLNHAKPRDWQAGDFVFHQQKQVTQFVVLMTGVVRIYTQQLDKEINLRFLCDGSVVVPFFALTESWQSNTPCLASETAQCVTDAKGLLIPFSFFDDLESTLALTLKLELSIRHYQSMEHRLKMLQMTLAKQRYATYLHTMPPPIIDTMPNHHVASYLGITPETLSRIKPTKS